MCVIALAWRAHPRWQLVVAANRDELHVRAAAPLARWDEPSHMLAGRDLQSGGSWLGVSEQGRFAAVTNLRGFGAPEPGRPSRGALVTDVLSGDSDYSDPAGGELAAFNPFNLVVAANRARIVSNRPETSGTLLAPGIYGLSNGTLDQPWPKVMRLKEILLEWMTGPGSDPRSLLGDLRDERLPEVGVRSAPPSDVPQEPPLSPIFIHNAVYGTRCSTVVTIDDCSHGVIIERRYSQDAEETGETSLSFSWPA
jgi:uncharacterized protein with NRDE domain